ncbi:Mu transposase C-terminal domain-containing protein [Nitrospirillum viridazoti]|uniref:Transposase n=1 Tax=Nitrospirillum amazonense TaxID=28077 RepID=A0A560J4S4_9PROT|nr:Mu transposase C-terminal domain-containing protein [Nitrospirillum amazonense]TWB64234.1 putative transposase [Nitrospirillum amazonense]
MPDFHPSDVTRFRFSMDDYVAVDGRAYRPVSADRRGHVLRSLEPDGDGLLEEFRHENLYALHVDGRLTVRPGWLGAEAFQARRRSDAENLADLPEAEQHTILWRAEWCDRYLQMEKDLPSVTRSDRAMALVIPQIHAAVATLEAVWQGQGGRRARAGSTVAVRQPPSPATLRRWLRLYQAAGYNAVGLRENWRRCGNRLPRANGDSHAFALAGTRAFLDSRRPTRRMVYEAYLAELDDENRRREEAGSPPLAKVSPRTFNRHISNLDPFEVQCGREGVDAARRKHRITAAGLQVVRPLQRVEIDECHLSLQVLLSAAGAWTRLTAEQRRLVERTRAWVTLAIDAATRCIMALRVFAEDPSSASAIATIEMALSDKTHLGQVAGAQSRWNMCGLIEEVVADSGSAFISRETKTVLTSLGIRSMNPPAKMPEMRARVERVFGTLQGHFIKYFAGQTFENVVVRGDYDAEGNASIDMEELNRTLVRWVVDAYHCSAHEGLAGETPASAWRRLTARYSVAPPPDARTRRNVFGLSCTRHIQGKGVRILGIHYQSPELQRLRRSTPEVEVRVDRFDLGEISVRAGDGWLTVKPVVPGLNLHRVTWWEWTAATADLRRRHADTANLDISVVREALSAIRGEGLAAARRAELGSPIIDADALERAERTLFETFAFRDDGVPGSDLLEGIDMVAAQRPPRQPASPAPNRNGFGTAEQPPQGGLRGDQFEIHDEDEE